MFIPRIFSTKIFLLTVTLLISTLMSCNVLSHARWVIPSHTIVSGNNPATISIDYSISNAIFHPDIAIGGEEFISNSDDKNTARSSRNILTDTSVILNTPENKKLPLKSINLGRKSSTYFTAFQPGTYRIDIQQPPIDITLFTLPNGEKSRIFGPLNDIREQLPEGAKIVESLQISNRIQTFVTRNQTTNRVLNPTGTGIELKQTTHPNELFANEKASYQILLNGKPLKTTAEIKITPGGTRFRNQRNTIEPKPDNLGRFSVSWPTSGRYLVEIEHKTQKNNITLVHALFLTLEVQPE